ncbi:MAG TPA: hypothetical protein VIL49_04930 [Capillimicrobium sp.]|jgi:hypothetical protein
MAADQRYCLECGARRGEPRVAYGALLRRPGEQPEPEPPAATVPVAVAAPPPARGPWTLPAALATVACLLLAMAIGVMIGRGGDDRAVRAAAPAPQIVTVGGAVEEPVTEEAAAGDAGDARPGEGAKAEKRARKDKGGGDAGASAPAGESQATNTAIQELEQLSPEEYQKQSQKLPKELGTGGAPPPKDDKAPAGGGAFEEIG